jgi:hypothetical protein
MPKIKPPPARNEAVAPVLERQEPLPTDDIEISLTEEEGGPAEVDLAAPEPTPQPTPAAPPAPEPPGDDALQRALEAQRRAEDLQRSAQRERDEAIRQAQQRDQELERERGEREDAEFNSVLTAIAAEQGALAKAKADYAAAAAAGDWTTAAEAQDAIAAARTELAGLERGKKAFETRRETRPAPTAQPAPREAAPAAPLDFEQRLGSLGVPESAKSWLRAHPEFINDAAMNKELGDAHNYLTGRKKVEPFSQAYFDALDSEFGFKAAPAAEAQPQPQPPRRSPPVSAPPSRDVPTPSGQRAQSSKITLTAEERSIARQSMSWLKPEEAEVEYARNKAKLARMRGNGEYPQSERN